MLMNLYALIFSIVIFTAGVLMLIGGIISRHRMKKREASYTGIATGTTIDEIIDTDNDGNEIFFPVISYTVNGLSYQIQSDTG